MNMRLLCVLCLALAMGIVPAAQAPGSIVRLDPAFDAIVPAGATVETLKEGFGFINGILWVPEGRAGHLLVSDIPANVIHKWTPPNTMTVFLDRPDWTRVAEARPDGVRFGANGIARDRQGRIVYAAEADRAVDPARAGRQAHDHCRAVRGQASQQSERSRLPIRRVALFHRPERRRPVRHVGPEEGASVPGRLSVEGREAAARSSRTSIARTASSCRRTRSRST